MTAVKVIRIGEHIKPGRRLGRHVHHDPRSRDYVIPPAVIKTVRWERRIPVFNQGSIGSCTGQAAAGVLGSDPFYPTMRQVVDEATAVAIYELATQLDPYPGRYPPEDTGSNGLAAAKACQRYGFIRKYRHALHLRGVKWGLQSAPMIVGTNWYSSMDNPDPSGMVDVTGSVRGGHEYECVGYDHETDVFEFVNSWGDGWGDGGHFRMTGASLRRLLAEDGDATLFLPAWPTP
jgi:hypothetical protein